MRYKEGEKISHNLCRILLVSTCVAQNFVCSDPTPSLLLQCLKYSTQNPRNTASCHLPHFILVQREEYLESLEAVSKKLQEQYPGAKFDRKSVGNLVALIKQFVEDALGIKVRPFAEQGSMGLSSERRIQPIVAT